MHTRKLGVLGVLLSIAFQLAAQGPQGYTLKVGDQFRVTAEVKQDIIQTMLGQEMETKQTITTVDIYEVVAVTNEGYKMRTTGLSRSLYTETGGGSVTLDSDIDGDDNLSFRVLTGKSYYVVMNRYGSLLRFEGMDDFNNAVKSDLEGTILEDQADALLSAFEEKPLKTAFDGQFYIYKEPGKDWSRSVDTEINQLPISVDYAFSRVDAQTIKAAGPMVMAGEMEIMGNMMTADMSGDQTTFFKLDSSTGLPRTINTLQSMSGSMEVSDLTVPMTLKTEVNVKVTK